MSSMLEGLRQLESYRQSETRLATNPVHKADVEPSQANSEEKELVELVSDDSQFECIAAPNTMICACFVRYYVAIHELVCCLNEYRRIQVCYTDRVEHYES